MLALTVPFASQTLLLKRPGRPKGAKDRRPRAKISTRPEQSESPCSSLLNIRGEPDESVFLSKDTSFDCSQGSFAWIEMLSEPFDGFDAMATVDPFHDDWEYW